MPARSKRLDTGLFGQGSGEARVICPAEPGFQTNERTCRICPDGEQGELLAVHGDKGASVRQLNADGLNGLPLKNPGGGNIRPVRCTAGLKGECVLLIRQCEA